MRTRTLGSTGYEVGEVGLGAWAIGADWGEVDDDEAADALRAALSEGVTFIDTADVYGDGRSERRIADALAAWEGSRVYVATKVGRRLDPHVAAGYSYDNLARFVDRSRANLGVEVLDLVQLHCPPDDAYETDTMFEAMERLVADGVVAHYGVSVETVRQALVAIEHPAVATIQIIFNMFRPKPAAAVFGQARDEHVGVIARVPLASGLLTGAMTADRVFAPDDHRNYNRHGQAFDFGETFSGVDFGTGLLAARELASLVPAGHTLAQFALRWILMHEAVSVVIPGAKSSQQVLDNVAAADLPALDEETMSEVAAIYDRYLRSYVHSRW